MHYGMSLVNVKFASFTLSQPSMVEGLRGKTGDTNKPSKIL